MRTSAGRGDAEEALSVRAARLLHTRSRFHRDQTSVEPDGDAKGYLGENGGTGDVPSLIIWEWKSGILPDSAGGLPPCRSTRQTGCLAAATGWKPIFRWQARNRFS